jgi:hypothetical protein
MSSGSFFVGVLCTGGFFFGSTGVADGVAGVGVAEGVGVADGDGDGDGIGDGVADGDGDGIGDGDGDTDGDGDGDTDGDGDGIADGWVVAVGVGTLLPVVATTTTIAAAIPTSAPMPIAILRERPGAGTGVSTPLAPRKVVGCDGPLDECTVGAEPSPLALATNTGCELRTTRATPSAIS